ncbi:MAG: winged helix-turn-helix domain-containing protein, partial [Pseudomonadota bacterium]
MKHYVSEDWSFTPHNRRLTVVGKAPSTLPPQVAQLLTALCEAADQTVSSYELIDEIWSGDMRVGEAGLRQLVFRLRRELPGDGQDTPAIINEPRKGYRLRDAVTESKLRLSQNHRRTLALAMVSLALGAVVLVTLLSKDPIDPAAPIETELLTVQSGYEES